MSEELSANTPEVAEQDTQSENTPEVAEQDTVENAEENERDFEKDSAFAEMRRKAEEAETKAQEAEAKAQELEQQRRLSELESKKNLTFSELERAGIEAGLSEEDILSLQEEAEEELQKEHELEELRQEKEALEIQNATFKAEQMMKSDLEVIQKLNPNINSIEDLGPNFLNIRMAKGVDGNMLTAEQAYFAAKALDGEIERNKPTAPDDIGKIGITGTAQKTFYTKEEVENMSEQEQRENSDKIIESMKSWGR